jgi:hypothetical protein
MSEEQKNNVEVEGPRYMPFGPGLLAERKAAYERIMETDRSTAAAKGAERGRRWVRYYATRDQIMLATERLGSAQAVGFLQFFGDGFTAIFGEGFDVTSITGDFIAGFLEGVRAEWKAVLGNEDEHGAHHLMDVLKILGAEDRNRSIAERIESGELARYLADNRDAATSLVDHLATHFRARLAAAKMNDDYGR